MKKLLIVLLIMFAFFANSQVRLGYTSYEIKKEYSALGYTVNSGYGDDGYLFYSINFSDVVCFYSFGKDDICTMCIILPKTSERVNGLSEKYNSKYTIISDSHWKAYMEGGSIADITLQYTKEYGYFFMWVAKN